MTIGFNLVNYDYGDMSSRSNIVIFNPDSYRGDVLRHLGNTGAVTPNLDALVADGGVSYRNAFAQNPVCTPSRCSFMTGWYPHTHGHRSMINLLKPHEPNLFSVLRRENYYIWWGGKNDLFAMETQEDNSKYCDTRYFPEEYYCKYNLPPALPADDPRARVFYRGVMKQGEPGPICRDFDRSQVAGAVDFINSNTGEQPFCIYLPLINPHPAYLVEDEFYDLIDPDSLPPRLPIPERDLPMLDELREIYRSAQVSEEEWRDIRRIYYAMCSKIDFLFGQVVDALKNRGIYDNTLIIFMSDHGDFTGDYSLPEKTHGSLQDVLLRVPLLIKTPAAIPAEPGVREQLVELVDMPATIYDILSIEPGYWCQGRSLRASLEGENREIREAVFAEVGARRGEKAFLNLQVIDMPPDSFYSLQSQAALPAHERGSYAVSCRTHNYKYIRRGYCDYHELYDLNNDPGELHNLSGNSEFAAVEKEMELRLLDYFMTTSDVLPLKQDARDA